MAVSDTSTSSAISSVCRKTMLDAWTFLTDNMYLCKTEAKSYEINI